MKSSNEHLELKLNSLMKESKEKEKNNQRNEDQSSSSRRQEIEKSMKEFKEQYAINQKNKIDLEEKKYGAEKISERKIAEEEHPTNIKLKKIIEQFPNSENSDIGQKNKRNQSFESGSDTIKSFTVKSINPLFTPSNDLVNNRNNENPRIANLKIEEQKENNLVKNYNDILQIDKNQDKKIDGKDIPYSPLQANIKNNEEIKNNYLQKKSIAVSDMKNAEYNNNDINSRDSKVILSKSSQVKNSLLEDQERDTQEFKPISQFIDPKSNIYFKEKNLKSNYSSGNTLTLGKASKRNDLKELVIEESLSLVSDESREDEVLKENDSDEDSEEEEDMKEIIKLENVQKTYILGLEGVAALRGVSLRIQPGEFVCVFGTSGGGKTTLLNIIGTIDKPTKGNVFVCGIKINNKTDDSVLAAIRLQKMAFVFQTFNLISSLTALENVELPMQLKGDLPKDIIKERSVKLLTEMGLQDRLNHYPKQLSGGEQQRVTIARALSNDPEIMLLDEPTGDLDTKNTDYVMKTLIELNKNPSRKITMLMVTHDLNLKNYGTKIVRMIDGKIGSILETPEEVRAKAIQDLYERIQTSKDNYISVKFGIDHQIISEREEQIEKEKAMECFPIQIQSTSHTSVRIPIDYSPVKMMNSTSKNLNLKRMLPKEHLQI